MIAIKGEVLFRRSERRAPRSKGDDPGKEGWENVMKNTVEATEQSGTAEKLKNMRKRGHRKGKSRGIGLEIEQKSRGMRGNGNGKGGGENVTELSK